MARVTQCHFTFRQIAISVIIELGLLTMIAEDSLILCNSTKVFTMETPT